MNDVVGVVLSFCLKQTCILVEKARGFSCNAASSARQGAHSSGAESSHLWRSHSVQINIWVIYLCARLLHLEVMALFFCPLD